MRWSSRCHPPEDAAAFTFTQGQYLTFRRDFDGQEIRRTYSICSGPR
jgi:ring-1,2-phenylacetyl-CoA epoxidase subunit PaaE